MQDDLDALKTKLEEKIGYQFQNRALLLKAITHSSTGEDLNYERLEFLGDRVLGLVMAQMLFESFKGENEGGLAKRHAALVQGKTLAKIAEANNLGEFVILSQSERDSGGAQNENILADVMEALLGAVFLDGGLDPAARLIRDFWGDSIHTMTEIPLDPKTELQEWVQARGLPLPVYDIVDKAGPDHAPTFYVEVIIEGFNPLKGQGSSRREAEKKAAKEAIKHIGMTGSDD